MLMRTTNVFSQNLKAYYEGYKIIVNQGGTSSSKTFSIMQLIILLAMSTTSGLISCVSESMPHLKRGVIRDFQAIMGDDFSDNKFNKSEHVYDFGKSDLEFFSADQASKLRGGRRNKLYINECNNISKDSFNELDVRTKGTTWLDFNPTGDFWAHDLLRSYGITDFSKSCFPADKNICFIHSTYQDSKDVLMQTEDGRTIVEKIESRKGRDPNWWRVYGLGLVGKLEGLVYPSFTIIDSVPTLHSPIVFYGLDFGFSGDPTVLIKNTVYGNKLYSEELIYQTEMTNQDIGRKMESLGVRKNYDEIFADSAEPKSIEEIYLMGFNIKGAPKPQGSVEFGHQKVNQYNQHWTSSSVKCIKEQRNFMFIKDKNGKLTDKTTHEFSHGMDARRYAIVGKFASDNGGYSLSAMSKL